MKTLFYDTKSKRENLTKKVVSQVRKSENRSNMSSKKMFYKIIYNIGKPKEKIRKFVKLKKCNFRI